MRSYTRGLLNALRYPERLRLRALLLAAVDGLYAEPDRSEGGGGQGGSAGSRAVGPWAALRRLLCRLRLLLRRWAAAASVDALMLRGANWAGLCSIPIGRCLRLPSTGGGEDKITGPRWASEPPLPSPAFQGKNTARFGPSASA